MLWSILFLVLVFVVILAAVLGVGTGVGFLLHWILPAIDLGMSILIGTVASAFSIFFATRTIIAMEHFQEEQAWIEEIDEILLKPEKPQRRSRRKKS